MTGEPPGQVLDELLRVYLRVWRGLHRLHQGNWRDSDLTMPQVKVLFSIQRGINTICSLAAEMGVSPPVITGIVDRLENRGLIERQRDSTDRRIVKIMLTALGEERVRLFQNLSEALLTRLFAMLAPEERQSLLAGFRALDRELARVMTEEAGKDHGRPCAPQASD